MVPDDLFRLETLGQIALSRGGDVAYVLQRPSASAAKFGRLYLWGRDRADIWIASADGASSRNVTNGSQDGAGFWRPVWSPDGQRLAMLSTRGGNIRLWVWSKQTGRLRPVSNRGVAPWPFVTPWPDFLWVSADRLLFWVMPEGEVSPRLAMDTDTPEIAQREWARAREGKESTASILESGAPPAGSSKRRSQMLLVDVDSGKIQVLCDAFSYGEYDFATLRLAPDHRWVAYLKQVGIAQPDSDHRITELINPEYELDITSLEEPRETHRLTGVLHPMAGSIAWSPDGNELAVIGYDATATSVERVFRCKIAEGICRPVGDRLLNLNLHARNVVAIPPYVWFGGNQLLIHGQLRSNERVVPREPPGWWAVNQEGRFHNYFANLMDSSGAPAQVVPDHEGNGLIAIMDGAVWHGDSNGFVTQRLSRNIPENISSLECLDPTQLHEGSSLLLRAHDSGADRYYMLNADSGHVEAIPTPTKDARLVACNLATRTFAFAANNDNGTYLWLKKPEWTAAHELLKTNEFLREIQGGRREKIEYRSLDGQRLHGWFILPFGYREGRRYPTVVWVQAGTVYGDEPLGPPYALDTINNSNYFNLQLLAAHGYVVLMPSMPLRTYGDVDERYAALIKGVLPAVEKLIDLNIADPSRIGIMGHSIGGYSVYGIITQTNLFKAAVASAGFSDLVSLYGTFDARLRYQQAAHTDLFRMWNVETGGMGGPPWQDLQRYIWNSPISHVKSVQTPLLIIQGDLDYIPIQQSEEFFTALYRQHKRAEFVRYWGEDHLLTSPANIRDMWRRIYGWFDKFLRD